MVSGTFHSPSGVLFTFPSRYLFTIGCWVVFSLTQWFAHQFTRGSTYPVLLGDPLGFSPVSSTGLSPSLAAFSKRFRLPERILLRSAFYCALLATLRPTPPRGKPLDFGLFRFRSPLLTESHSLSFPPLTEMFHFSGCRSAWTMNSSRSHWVHQWGFPIRRSSGQSLLPTNRGLSQVTASFIASQHQGIHLVPLVAYLNVSTYH